MKKLEVKSIENARGRPLRLPARGEDGEALLDDDGDVVFKDADTRDLLETIVLSIPRSIQKPTDPFRSGNVLRAIDAAEGMIKMTTKDHDWILRRLTTVVPRGPDANGVVLKGVPLSYAQTVFGYNANVVIKQLGGTVSEPDDEDEDEDQDPDPLADNTSEENDE